MQLQDNPFGWNLAHADFVLQNQFVYHLPFLVMQFNLDRWSAYPIMGKEEIVKNGLCTPLPSLFSAVCILVQYFILILYYLI